MARSHTSSLSAPPVRAPARVIEERLRLLVENVRDYAIFMLDVDGHVETWNHGAQLAKGYAAPEIIGRHIETFYTPEDRAAGRPRHLLARAVAEGRVEDEGWRVRKDGSRFWADVVLTALHDEHGVLCGFAKVTRDLTERRKLEEENVRLAQAQEAIRLRDEFLSIASHELRTPLAGLQLQLESLLAHASGLDPALVAKLRRANASGQRLEQLIDSLLDVSRIATGQFELRREALDLAALIADTVDALREAAAKARCAIDVTSAGPVWGQFDRLRLGQVISNLVTNALTYAAGHPISIRTECVAGEAVVTVRDHGPGVEPSATSRIFERFERAASMRHFGGLGIGLYVVREIVRMHGGTVAACNAPDGGACFTLRLPLEVGAS